MPPSSKTPAAFRSDSAKSRLLEAALVIFGQKGLETATVREIASAAGQNIAAISYYFGSKENLYHATIEATADEIQRRAGDVFSQAAQRHAAGALTPDDAIELIQRIIRGLYFNIASRQDALSFGRLVLREQTEPTSGFEILYERCFRQLHETLGLLVATALDVDPGQPEVIIRVHTLLGQVFAFRVARATILRRLDWQTLEGANAEAVTALIEENIEVLLCGLKSKHAAGSSTTRHPISKLKKSNA